MCVHVFVRVFICVYMCVECSPHCSLRWGWVFLQRTWILSGIQFTTHFIDFFVVKTKRFVGSTVNVILTQQTCGQHSSRAAESKRRALENQIFRANLLYVPNINLQRRLRSRSVHCVWYLRTENCCAMPNSDFSCGRNTFLFGSRHCAAVFFS